MWDWVGGEREGKGWTDVEGKFGVDEAGVLAKEGLEGEEMTSG